MTAFVTEVTFVDQTVSVTELGESLAAQTGVSKTAAVRAIRSLCADVAEHLALGRTVRLPDVGTFSVKETKAKRGTAPDGKPWTKPAGRRVAFRAAKTLKVEVGDGV